MIGIQFRGRLGNYMYQYAYIRSVAERNNYEFTVYFDNNKDDFLNIFPHLNIQYNSLRFL